VVPSLPWIGGRAPCYALFLHFVRLHRWCSYGLSCSPGIWKHEAILDAQAHAKTNAGRYQGRPGPCCRQAEGEGPEPLDVGVVATGC
jgi:hypothetical protein